MTRETLTDALYDRVRSGIDRVTNTAYNVRNLPAYHAERPEADGMDPDAPDMGAFHNMLNDDDAGIRGARFTEYHRAVDAVTAYLDGETETVPDDEFGTVIEAGYRMQRNADDAATQRRVEELTFAVEDELYDLVDGDRYEQLMNDVMADQMGLAF